MKRQPRSETFSIYVIASPADMHLAPWFFRRFEGQKNFHIIANGLTPEAVAWMQCKMPMCSISALSASLTGNQESFLAHGDVIDLIAEYCDGDFFICDADCLITDGAFLQKPYALPNDAYAMGPFRKDTLVPGLSMPETFLVMLNAKRYRAICNQFGITARITNALTPAVQTALFKKHGLKVSQPEPGKNYVDTLQQFWMAANASELGFAELPGAGEKFFHVGGSSYLLKNLKIDLAHWDYWPANTIYFHLKFLELANDPFLSSRLQSLTAEYGTSADFLATYAGLRNSWRFDETLRMISFLFPSN